MMADDDDLNGVPERASAGTHHDRNNIDQNVVPAPAGKHHHEPPTQQQQVGAMRNDDDDDVAVVEVDFVLMSKNDRLRTAKRRIQQFMISDTTMIIPYAEWGHQQDMEKIAAQQRRGGKEKKKKKQKYAYYGPIGGSDTFVFYQNRVKVCHCFTKSELDLGLTTYSVVTMQLLPEEKKKYMTWIQKQQQQDEENVIVLDEKEISFEVTPTSIGTSTKATNQKTGDIIDLTDYDEW